MGKKDRDDDSPDKMTNCEKLSNKDYSRELKKLHARQHTPARMLRTGSAAAPSLLP